MAFVAGLLPSIQGWQGHTFRDNDKVVMDSIYRYRARISFRDLAREEFGAARRCAK